MPECSIPVLIRLENNFYEINVKLKLKTKQKTKKYRKVADLFIFKVT